MDRSGKSHNGRALHNIDSESDSGDEDNLMEVTSGSIPVPLQKALTSTSKSSAMNDYSSSSGEEQSEEEIVMSMSSLQSSNASKNSKRVKHEEFDTASASSNKSASPIQSQASMVVEFTYWWVQEKVYPKRVSNRFYGSNKSRGHISIGEALSIRLSEKTCIGKARLQKLRAFLCEETVATCSKKKSCVCNFVFCNKHAGSN